MRKSKILSAVVLALLLTATTYTAGTVSTAAKTNTAAVKNVNTENMEFTEAYVKEIGKMSYFWGWPMVNMHNRYIVSSQNTSIGLQGGTVPAAPLNYLSMFHDYVDPGGRVVACPNQDVVYGQSMMSLDKDAVIVQVPDFKGRFWVYQIVNQRTDSIAELGSMYNSKPGFYMITGPDWKGTVPKEVIKVFHSDTKIAYAIPRIFMNDTAEDKKDIQEFINKIDIYPLSEFDGKVKERSWADLPILSAPATQGSSEVKWVDPAKFADELPVILQDVPPLAGEENLYATMKSVLEVIKNNPKLKEAFTQGAVEADKELVTPLFQFSNYGIKLKNNWTTTNNGADFGTDYYTRTAAAKSNIFINKAAETKYFYQDFDSNKERLNGSNKYTVTFPKGQIPPVNGFWSLTLYNSEHFFEPNEINRYSLGTKNKDLKYNRDGSLTLYVQSEKPSKDKESNWLPAPKNGEFSLYIRAYWPKEVISNGQWTPPAVIKTK